MKMKVLLIIGICVGAISLIIFLNKRDTVEQKQEVITPNIDLSAVSSKIELDPFLIENELDNYLMYRNIICDNAVALDYKYEDLDTADVIYDIFFQLDNRDKTIITLAYGKDEKSGKRYVEVKPCMYSREEIKDEVWYEEEKQ